jgi:Bacteriophage T4, Gp8
MTSSSAYSKNLQVFNAEQFKESVAQTTGATKLYFAYGKVDAWADENTPETANAAITSHNNFWKNMIGAKLLTGNDIYHVIPRYDWSANSIYTAYDDCLCPLYGNQFYVVTSDWNVYKCLYNANSSNSLVMPTQTVTTGTVTETDGYIWKYMYTISPAEQLKFTTSEYIPVKTLTADDNSLQWDVQSSAVPGSIEAIVISNVGDGYLDASITITGDGTDANAMATLNTQSNTISSIVIDNPGTDYTYATVTITSATGANAVARAMISPPGGHGSDPMRELGGSYLMINARLQNSEGDLLPVANDYRQVALLKDPLIRGTTTPSTNTVVKQYKTLTLNGVSLTDYVEDEQVYQSTVFGSATFTGTVLEYDSNIIKVINTTGTPTLDLLTGATSTASKFVDSITHEDLERYSGQILYMSNMVAIQRASDQTEDYKIVLKF